MKMRYKVIQKGRNHQNLNLHPDIDNPASHVAESANNLNAPIFEGLFPNMTKAEILKIRRNLLADDLRYARSLGWRFKRLA